MSSYLRTETRTHGVRPETVDQLPASAREAAQYPWVYVL
ncbi:MAG: hypothetical protein J07HX5_01294 [halophilic archaeon J07HX5]|nr:MAG: hypothetical protein J07HX5_01294 [halophilic archaeon J07HX5]